MAKRQQEGDYEERVVAKSKPVRNLVSKKPCRELNSAIIDGIFKPGELKQKNLTKSDAVEGSQVRYLDANSMTSAGVLVGWGSDQTMNSQVSTGRLVIKNSATENDLEATEENNIPSAESISFRDKGNERVRAILNRPPRDEWEEFEKHSLIWRICMTSMMYAAILSWKRLLRESATPSEIRIRN